MPSNDSQAVRESAHSLYESGYDVILVRPDKSPGIAKDFDWPNFQWSHEEFDWWLNRHPELQLALRLGGDKRIVDVEIDSDNEEEARRAEDTLSSLPYTASFRSRRGRHWLFALSKEQQSLLELNNAGSVVKILYKGVEIEVRLGLKPAQSLIPPSKTDGFQRDWIISLSTINPAEFPADLFEVIMAKLATKKVSERPVSDEQEELDRPGDKFNETADWSDILVPLGWTIRGEGDGRTEWTRPGKTEGLSATTGFCGTDARPDCLYIFSTSTEIEPFESGKTYTKFEAWTLLEHGGDYGAAASALVQQGINVEADGSEFDDGGTPSSDVYILQRTEPEIPIEAPPEPEDICFDFVIGEYVKNLIPYTEAYPPAMMFQMMEVAGILAGRNVHFAHGDYKFRMNGGCIVIGESGVSRKGTGLYYTRLPFVEHDLESVLDGFINETDQVSGEGFIQSVANRSENRMLLACEEFAAVMKVLRREGNTLSNAIRKALDAKPLGIDSRKNKIDEMPNAFVSFIGHCTQYEFIESITHEDIRNGLLNRFQFTLSRQTSKISFPEAVPEHIKSPVREAFLKLWQPREFSGDLILTFAPDARPEWDAFYQGDNPETTELRESLGARTPAQILRNASRVALLDGSNLVSAKHLRIAMAMQRYSAKCIDYIFGGYINEEEICITNFIEDGKNGRSWNELDEWASWTRRSPRKVRMAVQIMLKAGKLTLTPIKIVGRGRPTHRIIVTPLLVGGVANKSGS